MNATTEATKDAAVSVVIPAFDAAPTLARCVESVLRSCDPPLEVIVADDASTDATPAIVRRLVEVHGDRVRHVRIAERRGAAAARNAGAHAARAPLVFFVDADTELANDALGRFRASIREADAVSGVYAPEPLEPAGAAAVYKALFDHFNFSRAGVTSYDGFSAYCAGVRREVFFAAGGFDETLGPECEFENEDFGYRLAVGRRTLLDPSIRARHHFPGFARASRNYLVRVKQWTLLFLERRRFEQAGDATASGSLRALAAPCALAAWLGAPASTVATAIALASSAAWLAGAWPFLRFVARERPRFVVAAAALNFYFACVICAGAALGCLTYAVRWVRQPTRRAALAHPRV